MRKTLSGVALATILALGPAAVAGAQGTDDPNDVPAIDNPVDPNDESGFDDWGLLGLIGLLGLAGLARRSPSTTTVGPTRDRDVRAGSTTGTGTGNY
jgi:MYXO-CTERM domain-containing protein